MYRAVEDAKRHMKPVTVYEIGDWNQAGSIADMLSPRQYNPCPSNGLARFP